MFKHLRRAADEASRTLAAERGACPDAAERGALERFSHKLAIAPTASISVICGGTSACIEPIPANIYTHKTLSGSFSVRNPALTRLLESRGSNHDDTWQSILAHEGSVQHLDCLTDDEKSVFRTAFEIDQRWVVELAADRAAERRSCVRMMSALTKHARGEVAFIWPMCQRSESSGTPCRFDSTRGTWRR